MKFEIEGVTQRLVELNKSFSTGTVVNKSSLEFAVNAVYKSKDWQEQLTFVARALLCNHVFADGNKRTAAAYIMAVLEDFKHRYDPFRIDRLVLKIAKNNITNIRAIRKMIENASSKNL